MFATQEATAGPFELVTFDLYRDIHKGIRAELFAVTGDAGRLDPADRAGRADMAAHVGSVVDLLVFHAEHEDAYVQPAIESYLPDLAPTIVTDHAALESRIVGLRELAEATVDAAAAELAGRTHHLYLGLASFTSAYLAHQDYEEQTVMPALEAAIGVPAVIDIHGAVIASIPPEVMAKTLALMLPAMNVDNRTELLGGMKANAPAEVFKGVWSLAGSVLAPCELAAVAGRLGVA